MATILKHMKTRKRRTTSVPNNTRSKRRNKIAKEDIWTELSPGGVFTFLPLEVCHLVFSCTPLPALGMLSLTSRNIRDMVVTFVYSSQASECIIPNIEPCNDRKMFVASMECHSHYRNLGNAMF